jgi:hypothetical protein
MEELEEAVKCSCPSATGHCARVRAAAGRTTAPFRDIVTELNTIRSTTSSRMLAYRLTRPLMMQCGDHQRMHIMPDRGSDA